MCARTAERKSYPWRNCSSVQALFTLVRHVKREHYQVGTGSHKSKFEPIAVTLNTGYQSLLSSSEIYSGTINQPQRLIFTLYAHFHSQSLSSSFLFAQNCTFVDTAFWTSSHRLRTAWCIKNLEQRCDRKTTQITTKIILSSLQQYLLPEIPLS